MKFSLYKRNIFPILFSLSFYSCSIEPDLDKLPIIQPSFGFSIFREAVTLNDVDIFTEDSSITKESFGANDSIFVFNKTINIDKQEVGDKLSIDDINKQFSQNVDNISIEDAQVEERVGFDPVGIEPVVESISSVVGTISLGNITPQNTEPYLLSTIFPGVSAFPDGSTQNVPSFELDPATNNFSFNDFSSAIFSAGILSLSIVNDLVIPLGDINIQLQNSDGVNISGASTLISGPINPATTATGNLDLSGITLPGSIIIEVTGSSPGGDNILINDASINSSFSVQISGTGLEVTSATAKIPEQIISESGEITMASDSNKVVLATISQGNLVIEIDNYMALGSEMSLTIPSLKTSAGNDFQTSISISGNTADIIDQTDISGYSLSMDIDDQAVVYTYEILTVDTENELISIQDTDSIIVNIQLEGSSDGEDISFSSFEGLVTPQNIGFNGEMAIDSDSDILEANLNSGSLIININNPINGSVSGAPSAMITISELISTIDDQALTIDTGPMSGQMDPISVDLDNYKLILPQADQNLYYVADVQTAYEVGTYSLLDSITIQITVSNLGFSSVRGFFSQDAMVDSNSIVLDDSTIIHNATLKSGNLLLSIENYIGIQADVFFQIDEFFNSGSMLDTTFSIASGSNSVSIDLSNYSLVLPSDIDTQKVNYVSRISLPSDQEMTLSLDDSIEIIVDMTDISFSSVTGQIKPVTVDIDPVEQTIDALPEELDGFDFESVEMNLDFSSSIDLPVYLDLIITAYNDENGDSVFKNISQNIHADPLVIVPNASDLINIRPDRIIARGSAQVGHLDSLGMVANDDSLSGLMSLRAPLVFMINSDALITPDPSEMDSTEIPDGVLDIALNLSIDNQWSFGADLVVLMSPDSLSFFEGNVDTLISDFYFSPNSFSKDTLLLDGEAFELLKRSPNWIQPQIKVVSDEQSPVRFLSTDTLTITINGLSATIDLSNIGDDE